MEVQKAKESSCGCREKLKYNELIIRLEMIREKLNMVSEEIRGLHANNESFSLLYSDCMENKAHINYLQQAASKTSEQRELEAFLRREVEDKEAKLNGLVVHFNLLQMQLVTHMKENITDLQQLQSQVLDELVKWKHEQQLSGNGVPMQLNLDEIQNLCEPLADLIWSTKQLIMKVMNINDKILTEMRQSRDNEMLDDINKQVISLLSTLIASTFVIEKQPQQVIKVNTRFTASVRLLVARPLNVHMTSPQVTVMLISEEQAQLLSKSDCASWRSTLPVECGDIINNSACMEYEPTSRKVCVHFRNMQIIRIKRAAKKGTASVTYKKLVLFFHSEFNVGVGELIFMVSTISLPVVVIDKSKQEARGWATITWDNAFRPPGHVPFVVPDKVSWGQLADTLRIKFRSEIGGDLSEDNLRFLAKKLFSSSQSLDNMELDDDVTVTWTQFCKSALPGRHFTFWEWFYMVFKVIRDHYSNLWCDRLIIGFIQKNKAEEMLSKSSPGTFLLRFSDSELGGITIAWVEVNNEVFHLQPFTHEDLMLRSLVDRILDLPQLQFLYPNVPKNDVFSKYYTKPEKNLLKNDYVRMLLVTTLPPYMSASPSSTSPPSYAPSPLSTSPPSYGPLPSSTPPPPYSPSVDSRLHSNILIKSVLCLKISSFVSQCRRSE
ncbi:unnamed protein product [Euphydryas editha]|uniref:Signal transducer and activator of transcription n=1 Tax=Euphydryas editha TaxID=104508 RepID=A0AAU9TFD2_EUPED|nr:unnamed protein product [Euphydryas editha]